MIIDAHCHAGEGDGFTGPWDTSARLGAYLRRAQRARITHTCLFPAFHSDYRTANRNLGAFIRKHPERFFGFACLHAGRDAGRIRAMISEAVQQWGACGLKVHGHDHPLTREVCETAQAFHLPLLFDPTGNVAPLELLAAEFPALTFIIPHMGSFADDWRAQFQLIDGLVRHPNLFADTSGVRRFDLLLEGVRRAGAGKFLFGSDGPWLHPGLELAKIRALGLSPKDEARILSKNFLRLTERARRAWKIGPQNPHWMGGYEQPYSVTEA